MVVTQIINVKQIRGDEIIEEDFWYEDGVILDPQKRFWEVRKAADIVIDGSGLIVAPGLIDIQINGGFSVDFSTENLTQEDIKKVAKKLLKSGTTSFLPTLITSSPSIYKHVTKEFQKFKNNLSKNCPYSIPLGIHMEGPFISEKKFGAHNKEFLQGATDGMESIYKCYNSLENIKLITMAPEVVGIMDLIPILTKNDENFEKKGEKNENKIVISLGHSLCDLELAEKAISKGATLITHLFNAMIPFHHRDPGLVGILGSQCNSNVFYSMILDGIHSNPTSVKIAYTTHPKGLILITDGISALGLKPGNYYLGTMQIEVNETTAIIANENTLAGSIASLDTAMKNFVKFTGASIVEAIHAASLHPAQLLNITDKKGNLDFGTDADFILIDQNLTVFETFISGNSVWKKNK